MSTNGVHRTCEEIYRIVVDLDTSDDYSLFQLAQCFIDGYDPEKLRDMLNSGDAGIVLDGLFILGEIGDLAARYVAEVDALRRSEDGDIRKAAAKFAYLLQQRESAKTHEGTS